MTREVRHHPPRVPPRVPSVDLSNHPPPFTVEAFLGLTFLVLRSGTRLVAFFVFGATHPPRVECFDRYLARNQHHLPSSLPELLSQTDEESIRGADVAQAVHVLIVDQVAYERRTELSEPGNSIVEVVDRKHHPQVTEGVDRRGAVIGGNGRCVKLRELEAAMTVRRAHHRNLDALTVQPGHPASPLPFDRRPSFEGEPEFAKEGNRGIQILHDDANVVHPFDCHATSWAS